MRVLLVEPLGHLGGHPSEHTKHLVRTLANAGVNVTLLTFDGLTCNSAGLDVRVTHISFVSKIGALAPLVRCLPRLFPSKVVQGQFDRMFSTYCTFFAALRQNRREKYNLIHVLDACTPDYDFAWFASVVNHCSLAFTLFPPSSEAYLEDWWARFKESLSNRRIIMGLQLCLHRLRGTRLATTLRGLLYRRGDKRNRQAFICYTSTVRDSYSSSPFYDKIVLMFRGVPVPEQRTLMPLEARQCLGLPPDGPVLLHFGINHLSKNFEVIFQAAKDLPQPYTLLFAGKIKSASQENNPLRLAKKYGLQQNTIIIDKYFTDEEVRYYFCAADAVIISHRKDFKGASGVLSTAAQYNLPVISTDIGDIGETIKKYKLGLTFEAENPLSLREAILSFLNLNEEEKQEMKRNLSYFAQTHSWQEAAQRHVELYQGLIKAKSTPR